MTYCDYSQANICVLFPKVSANLPLDNIHNIIELLEINLMNIEKSLLDYEEIKSRYRELNYSICVHVYVAR